MFFMRGIGTMNVLSRRRRTRTLGHVVFFVRGTKMMKVLEWEKTHTMLESSCEADREARREEGFWAGKRVFERGREFVNFFENFLYEARREGVERVFRAGKRVCDFFGEVSRMAKREGKLLLNGCLERRRGFVKFFGKVSLENF